MQPTLRILDANLNRAREGLRTCEEYARLALNDARSAQAVKSARRAVAACSDLLGLERLLSARNVGADPGIQPEAADVARGTPKDIALAGIKRAQEALRVVEEFSQLENAQAAAAAAKARYAAYEAEQQLFVAAPRRQLVRSSPLMVIFTRSMCRRAWPETLSALYQAGARLYQLREKEASAREFAEFAAAFTEQAPDACVIINDRADVAALHGAGVHVGQADLAPDDARRVAGPAAIVGVSTHDVTEALRAEAQGADYIGLGAMFETGTKVVQSHIGPAAISAVAARVSIPVFAIGGITPENVKQIAGAGGRQAAVSSALLGAVQPAEVFRLLLAGLGEGR